MYKVYKLMDKSDSPLYVGDTSRQRVNSMLCGCTILRSFCSGGLFIQFNEQ